MPELPTYPAVISVAVAVATAVSLFAGVPFPLALVLVVSGVAAGGFAAYKPQASAEGGNAVQRGIRRFVADALRLAIGTAIIAGGAVLAVLAVR